MIRVAIIEDVDYVISAIKGFLQQNNHNDREQAVEIVGVFKHPDEFFHFVENDPENKIRPIDIITFDAIYSASTKENPNLAECKIALEKLGTLRHQIPCLEKAKAILLTQNERILRLLPEVWHYVHGCINKDDMETELSWAVRVLANSGMGTTFFNRYDAQIEEIKHARGQNGIDAFWRNIQNERQSEILALLLKGWVNQNIGYHFEIAPANVSARIGMIQDVLARHSNQEIDTQLDRRINIVKLCIELNHPYMVEFLNKQGFIKK